ncbi:MAG TPA: tRNA (adenosine(37)-N6)-threonylcarbamoyltransferase complex ATPase subunit type 1 TsaE [Candidatus Eremiobacteraeota bacterium]|nr:MAG: tRNA threonylcarbamoyladenosine biosynthesis protein TsaE [bacterium ADurb.Bin363]HPZ10679.1 tRNA (adenosine(37)-N6)-threonylcarbamoyltransferase complex ATPase subunit type 1 TsaE [Candidatus Eremiobacteraeota bacterium]
MKIIITNSPEETEILGQTIAGLLKKGDVVAFTGELGAGKTFLIKAICTELVVKEVVSSPTFTLIQEYRGRLPVYHFDLYRLKERDLFDLGYQEYFEGDGICLIEWADRAENLLPEDHIRIHMEYLEDISSDNFFKRMITLSGRKEFSSKL